MRKSEEYSHNRKNTFLRWSVFLQLRAKQFSISQNRNYLYIFPLLAVLMSATAHCCLTSNRCRSFSNFAFAPLQKTTIVFFYLLPNTKQRYHSPIRHIPETNYVLLIGFLIEITCLSIFVTAKNASVFGEYHKIVKYRSDRIRLYSFAHETTNKYFCWVSKCK